jgi:hypothetical protein
MGNGLGIAWQWSAGRPQHADAAQRARSQGTVISTMTKRILHVVTNVSHYAAPRYLSKNFDYRHTRLFTRVHGRRMDEMGL